MVLFFFFQAEDGIRDLTVTGVQTCALPIFRRIGRELNVRYALEGSVRRAGSALRITAQLIDVETEEHLWAEKYSGTVDDVFDLQERLSRQIVEALRITLSPPEDRELAQRPIADIRAFEYYQRARQEYYRHTDRKSVV